MNKLQLTTTGGLAGLTASIKTAVGLFDGYTFGQMGRAFEKMPIDDALLALFGICVSVWFILHNEDKNGQSI